MGRNKSIPNLFKAESFKGDVGFDNPRQNIDPHIITKVIDTKEIKQDGVSYDLSTFGGGGVTSFSKSGATLLTGDVYISEGNNITLTQSNKNISIAATVGGDAVTSVFTRSGAVVAATNDYTWAQINKGTSSIADITTKSHTALSDIGTDTHAQIDTKIISISAATLLINNISGATLYLNQRVIDCSGATLYLGGQVTTISAATLIHNTEIKAISGATLNIPSISAATLINKTLITSGSNPGHTHTGGGAVTVLGTGAVTIATSTAAYDIDYADIPISGGAVTDMIIIEMQGCLASDKAMNYQVCINDVTSALVVQAADTTAGGVTYVKTILVQDRKVTDKIDCFQSSWNGTTLETYNASLDSNDADVFTTAFTIRLNFKHASQPANMSDIIGYKVYKISS